MNPAVFDTRLTRMLGIRHPLLLGGMHHLGQSGLVAGVVNAGSMGFITPRSFDSHNEFRQDLRACQALTGGQPCGVNLTISRRPDFNRDVQDWINIAFEEGVRIFESAGSAPDDLIGPIHEGGGVLIHKCPSVRHALTAERLGVDVVAIVGCEEGGHPGMNELSTFVNATAALDALSLPIVFGGGIGTGRQIAAAIALGADGVVMGSRFMVSSEAAMHHAVKEHIVGLDPNCSMTILTTLKDTWRVMINGLALEVRRREEDGARSHQDFGDLILSSRTRERVYSAGDIDGGIVSIGPAGGFADRVEPAASIVDRLMADAAEATGRFASTWSSNAKSH
jgi:NADH:quinone reductase (non-electrogenic)